MANTRGGPRKDRSPWDAGIKGVDAKDRPISERIQELNIAIRQDKRDLRTGMRPKKTRGGR